MTATILARWLMDAAGINWADVPVGDRLNAVVGICVGAVGVFVGCIASVIAFQQYRMAVEAANRRASLSLVSFNKVSDTLNASHENPINRYRCELRLLNTGDLATQDVYWTVFMPHSTAHRVTLAAMVGTVVGAKDEGTDEHGDRYQEWSGVTTGPVYGNHSVPFARVSYFSAQGTRLPKSMQRCEYRLDCRDGRFPTKGLGTLDVSWAAGIADMPDVKNDASYVDPPVDNYGEHDVNASN